MNPLSLTILCGLATWRFSSLLHTEDAFEWLRSLVGIENGPDGHPVTYPDGVLGDIFNCFWCLSLVAALPIAICATAGAQYELPWAVPVWLGASAVAVWLEKQIMRTQSR